MSTVIDLFWSVLEDAKANTNAMDPIRSPMHPLNSPMHPLRSPTHPLRSPTHALNSPMTANRGVRRIHALQELLEEHFPRL